MTGGLLTLAVLAVFAVLILVRLSHQPTERLSNPVSSSPLDEAERILAFRYARGRITAEEYERMLTILRS